MEALHTLQRPQTAVLSVQMGDLTNHGPNFPHFLLLASCRCPAQPPPASCSRIYLQVEGLGLLDERALQLQHRHIRPRHRHLLALALARDGRLGEEAVQLPLVVRDQLDGPLEALPVLDHDRAVRLTLDAVVVDSVGKQNHKTQQKGNKTERYAHTANIFSWKKEL